MHFMTEVLGIQWHGHGASLALDHQHAGTGIASADDVVVAMRREFPSGLARLSETEQRIAESMAVQGYGAMHRRLAQADTMDGGLLTTQLHPAAEAMAAERELARVFHPKSEHVLLANDRRVHATLRMTDGDMLVVLARAPLLAVLARTPSMSGAAEQTLGTLAGHITMLLATGLIVSATPMQTAPVDPDGAARLLTEFVRTTGRCVRSMRAGTGSHVTLATVEASFTLRLAPSLTVLRRLPDADPGLSRGMNADALHFADVIGTLASHGAIVTMSF